jgi:hypothetical protein
MSQAASAVISLDYYLPEPRELQAALRPIVTLHPEYSARQLRAIITGISFPAELVLTRMIQTLVFHRGVPILGRKLR